MRDNIVIMGESEERESLFARSILPEPFPNLSQPTTSEHQHLTQQHSYKGGWSFYLVLGLFSTTLGLSISVGYNIGVINTPAEIIQRFCNASVISHYDVELGETWLKLLWSSVVSIFIVGACTGSILGSFMADKFGRKNATIFTGVLFLLGAVVFQFCRAANSVEMLVLGRLIAGLASGLTTSIVPMYLAELSPARLTGVAGVACPMGVNMGVLIAQVMGLDAILGGADDWPYLLAAFAILVIISLPMLVILPESPKYLFIVKDDEHEALRVLARLRGVSASILTEEVEVMREERRAGQESKSSSDAEWGMLRVASDPKLLLPLLLACSMQAGQQTSGINAVFYYSQTIFTQSGLTAQASQYATIGCGAINVCTAILMLYLIPRFGRRPLLLGSIMSAIVLLTLLGIALMFISAVSWMPYLCMVSVLAYVLVYGFGLGPIPYFIASEIFEVGPRPGGMAWGSLANWGGNFLVAMFFPLMRDAIGPYSFLVFAAITTALFVFQKLYFPETRGRTPAEIAELCSQGFRSRPLQRRIDTDIA